MKGIKEESFTKTPIIIFLNLFVGEDAPAGGLQTPVVDAGLTTPSGMSSVGLGLGGETPELLELRKRRIEAEMEGGDQTPNLYTVLPERRAASGAVGAAMMGSTHTYDVRKAGMAAAAAGAAAGAGAPGGGAVSAVIDSGQLPYTQLV